MDSDSFSIGMFARFITCSNQYLDDDDRSCSTNPSTVKSKITISPSVTGSHQDSAYQTSSEKGKENYLLILVYYILIS